jgi:hypothetical protein
VVRQWLTVISLGLSCHRAATTAFASVTVNRLV